MDGELLHSHAAQSAVLSPAADSSQRHFSSSKPMALGTQDALEDLGCDAFHQAPSTLCFEKLLYQFLPPFGSNSGL